LAKVKTDIGTTGYWCMSLYNRRGAASKWCYNHVSHEWQASVAAMNRTDSVCWCPHRPGSIQCCNSVAAM